MASEQSISQERLEPSILIGGADVEGVVEPSVAPIYFAPCVHHDSAKVPGGNESVGGSSKGIEALDLRARELTRAAGLAAAALTAAELKLAEFQAWELEMAATGSTGGKVGGEGSSGCSDTGIGAGGAKERGLWGIRGEAVGAGGPGGGGPGGGGANSYGVTDGFGASCSGPLGGRAKASGGGQPKSRVYYKWLRETGEGEYLLNWTHCIGGGSGGGEGGCYSGVGDGVGDEGDQEEICVSESWESECGEKTCEFGGGSDGSDELDFDDG